MPKTNQQGLAQLAVLLILLSGLFTATYLVTHGTNFFPNAFCEEDCGDDDDDSEDDDGGDDDDDDPDDDSDADDDQQQFKANDDEGSDDDSDDSEEGDDPDKDNVIAEDGQSLDGQDDDTQKMFEKAFGEDADKRWREEHDDECDKGWCDDDPSNDIGRDSGGDEESEGNSEEVKRSAEEVQEARKELERQNSRKAELEAQLENASEEDKPKIEAQIAGVEKEINDLSKNVRTSERDFNEAVEEALSSNLSFNDLGTVIGNIARINGVSPEEASQIAISEVTSKGGDLNDAVTAGAMASDAAGGSKVQVITAAEEGAEAAIKSQGKDILTSGEDILTSMVRAGVAIDADDSTITQQVLELAKARGYSDLETAAALAGVNGAIQDKHNAGLNLTDVQEAIRIKITEESVAIITEPALADPIDPSSAQPRVEPKVVSHVPRDMQPLITKNIEKPPVDGWVEKTQEGDFKAGNEYYHYSITTSTKGTQTKTTIIANAGADTNKVVKDWVVEKEINKFQDLIDGLADEGLPQQKNNNNLIGGGKTGFNYGAVIDRREEIIAILDDAQEQIPNVRKKQDYGVGDYIQDSWKKINILIDQKPAEPNKSVLLIRG